MNTRRHFLTQLAALAGLSGVLPVLAADAPPRLDESDPTAKALGYTADTTKVDGKKYPTHKPDQRCVGCALYQGAQTAAEGPCTAFAGKRVNAHGWCMAYAPKPKA